MANLSSRLYPYQQDMIKMFTDQYSAHKAPTYDAMVDRNRQKALLASKMKGSSKAISAKIKNVNPPRTGPTGTKGGTITVTPTTSVQWITTNTVTTTTSSGSGYISNQQLDAWYKQQMNAMMYQKSVTNRYSNDDIYRNDYYDDRPREPDRNLRKAREYLLPDGSKLKIDVDGNFVIDDKDTKVVYKANRTREFNRYMNASDLLEEFIKYLDTLNVRQSEVADLPVTLFVNWLVIRAAEADGEQIPDEERQELSGRLIDGNLPCLECGGKINPELRRLGSRFCSGAHMDQHMLARPAVAEQPMLQTEALALVD